MNDRYSTLTSHFLKSVILTCIFLTNIHGHILNNAIMLKSQVLISCSLLTVSYILISLCFNCYSLDSPFVATIILNLTCPWLASPQVCTGLFHVFISAHSITLLKPSILSHILFKFLCSYY